MVHKSQLNFMERNKTERSRDEEQEVNKNGNLADDFRIGEINVSQLFRKYQNESIKIAKADGLFVESNVHEILSLPSIFLLFPECELKFRDAVKKATKNSCSFATDWLLVELVNSQTMKENIGFVILEYIKSLPTVKIKNEPSETTLITNHSDHIMKGVLTKARRGSHKEEANNLTSQYLLYQLQKNGVYSWDCLDSAIDLGADIKILGFQCVVDFYMMDLIQGIYTMIHIGQISVPASVKEMSSFISDIEILLGVREIFCPPSKKANFKRDTLGTPKFKQLVGKTRD
ncbi:15977_t:CDS:2 [Acaulospora colombiana]|uniref:15977_t:CDS:1 n=1 Tax=Acaulospora colombiana TaxID=27376 RepID=A0ACA9K7T0_9GLOM|nr:15977_t:CDS:2 [Acaulospora colombiana]